MSKVGLKTKRLSELKDLKFKVPKFASISSTQVLEIVKDKDALEKLAKKIHKDLGAKTYAVRSSALIEDSSDKSFAGQFETFLDVAPNDMAKAILAVTDQAMTLLKGDLSQFSLLIQEFIDPDFSGVTFTRNPMGGRELVIEYHAGVGEELVSGRIKPKKLEYFWNQRIDNSELPNLDQAVKKFKEIEEHYSFPQDIEWCIKDGEWFFLQTRPVTTLDDNAYKQSLFLDETLPKNKAFLYEKTEISEIAARPTQVTKDLLELVYANGGPIQAVYKAYRVSYTPKKVLKIIGNELFVDREAELQTLMPAYSYLSGEKQTAKLVRLRRFFRSFMNSMKIRSIPTKNGEHLLSSLKKELAAERNHDSVVAFLKHFLEVYKLVFEINLLTGRAFNRLESLLKDSNKMTAILSSKTELVEVDLDFELSFNAKEFKGNSLDIGDETQFISNLGGSKTSKTLLGWWSSLSNLKKEVLKTPIREAIIFNRLREMSRWLVVKEVSTLRSLLFEIAKKNHFHDKRLVFFSKLDELQQESISKAVCKKRKLEFEKYAKFNLPTTLHQKPLLIEAELKPVSSGKAEGVLVTEEMLKTHKGKSILYTKNLEPRLTELFPKIEGILSENGSMLSHLAIIAREEGIPVIVNFSLENTNLVLGEKVQISTDPLGITKIV